MGRPPCCDDIRELKKGPWTPEEDDKLVSYIQKHGHGSWRSLPKAAGLNRCGKSCRLRWTNYLRPDIKRGHFTQEEEDLIIELHSVLGNKWSRIAAHLPGRTDNEIKNYWNTHLRKKLLQMGIDPITHKPRLTDLNFLANLTQLLTNPPNLGPLSNTNNRLQQNNVVSEVAKLQVLQNIVQILNTPPSLPNMDQTMQLNLGLFPNLNGLGSIGHNNNYNNVMCNYELYQNLDDISDCKKSLSGNIITTTYETLEVNRLPSLVNIISPEASNVNQIESNTNSTNGSPILTPTTGGDFFHGWGKLLDDANGDFWKQFIN